MQRVAVSVASVLVVLFVAGGLGDPAAQTAAPRPPHHARQGFRNLDASYSYSLFDRASRLVRRLRQAAWPRGKPLDVRANDGAALRANGFEATATWVGHSTFLVQLEGINILTDHHLDAETVARIARAHDPVFIVPLHMQPLLADMGARHVVELDWWQGTEVAGLTFVCTPAQHSSGRTLNDQNRRLWSSWAVVGRAKRFFFAGDTGYFWGFRAIGERLGPFDLAAVPIGGYRSYVTRHPNHVNPEEAVQLFEDVGGRLLLPMHWGTFDMNSEPFAEPPARLTAEARRRGLAGRV